MTAFKSGDLVFVVSAHPTHSHVLGRILTLTKQSVCKYTGAVGWVTMPEVYSQAQIGTRLIFPEQSLRKIEDKPGEDETFQWAGKPVKEEQE